MGDLQTDNAGTPILLNTDVLEKVERTTIACLLGTSLEVLWQVDVCYDKALLPCY